MDSYSVLLTFFLYTAVFCLSGYFAWLHGEKNRSVFGVLAVVLPAIFSAARGANVGTDFSRYLNVLGVYSESLFRFFWETGWQYHSSEYGYYLLAWISANCFENKTLSFFIIYGVMFMFFYLGLRNLSLSNEIEILIPSKSSNMGFSNTNIWIGYTTFLFSMCIPSYNLLRQSLALSVLMLSIRYIFDKNFWKFAVLVVIASMFHFSSLIAFAWYFLCGNYRYYFLRWSVLVVVALLAPFGYDFFSSFLGYGNYLYFGSPASGGFLLFLFFVPLFFSKKSNVTIFCLFMCFWGGYSILLAYFFPGVNRFFYMISIIVPIMGIFLPKSEEKLVRVMWWFCFFVYVIFYRFFYSQIYGNSGFYFEWVK